MAKRDLELDDVLALIEREIEKAGSASAYARHLGVSDQFISSVRAKKKLPSRQLTESLGLVDVGRRWRRG